MTSGNAVSGKGLMQKVDFALQLAYQKKKKKKRRPGCNYCSSLSTRYVLSQHLRMEWHHSCQDEELEGLFLNVIVIPKALVSSWSGLQVALDLLIVFISHDLLYLVVKEIDQLTIDLKALHCPRPDFWSLKPTYWPTFRLCTSLTNFNSRSTR